jgi:hypothetical protein
MLHDRNPKLTIISDKLQVRDYVNEIVGSEYLVPMLWSGDNPEEIPLDMLPTRFVIKTNHGCRYNIIVEDKAKYDRVEAQLKLTRWLSENFCQDKFLGTEWGYKNIKPTIIVESFIGENRKPPIDYKFWCFSGRVECLTMHFNRFTEHEFRAFNRSFEPIDFGFGPTLPVFKGEWERPSNYETMLRVADSLAKGFGFMRVDLYNLGNKIYFGELTPYPGGITVRFCPPSWDRLLGEKWKGM